MYPYQQFPYQPYQFIGGAAQPLWSQPQQASDGLSNVRFVSGEVEARQRSRSSRDGPMSRLLRKP